MTPSELAIPLDTPGLRARSKDLLGGLYRAEVAGAVAAYSEADCWARDDVVRALDPAGVPASCVTKELATLLKWGLIVRHELRSPAGRYQYSRASFPGFWDLAEALATGHALETERPPVQPVSKRSESTRTPTVSARSEIPALEKVE